MDNFKDTLYKLRSKKLISFEEKFEKIICNTSIATCKGPKQNEKKRIRKTDN